MRLTLGRLFGQSPFNGIETLMDRVVECAAETPELVQRLIAGDQTAVAEQAKRISRLEGRADDAKNQVRSKMPVRLFLPVDRRDVLKLISQIDAIADCAEDVGVLLTLREMNVPDEMKDMLLEFANQNVECVRTGQALVQHTSTLLSTSFAGKPADHARLLIDQIAREEHETDKLQDQLCKVIFSLEDSMSPVAIAMWLRILEEMGDMANHSENIGDQYRLFLAG